MAAAAAGRLRRRRPAGRPTGCRPRGVGLVLPRGGVLRGRARPSSGECRDSPGPVTRSRWCCPGDALARRGRASIVRTAPLDGEVVADAGTGVLHQPRATPPSTSCAAGPVDDGGRTPGPASCTTGIVTLDDVRASGRTAAAVLREPRRPARPRAGGRTGGVAAGDAAAAADAARRAPAPVAQFRVFDDDGFVARLDFAYPELRLAIEYDGLWHAERRPSCDRRRLNRLVGGRMDGAARDRRGHAAAGAPGRAHPRGDRPAPGEGRGTLSAPTSTT